MRHGTEAGSVTLGGRRVPVTRPRMRSADGTGDLPVPSYDMFSSTEVLERMAMGRMLSGLSTSRAQRRNASTRYPGVSQDMPRAATADHPARVTATAATGQTLVV